MKNNNSYTHILLKISQILLVFFGVFEAFQCTIARLELNINTPLLVIFLFVGTAAMYGIFMFLESIPGGRWIGFGAILMLYVVFFLRLRQVIMRGLVYVVNSFLKLFMDYSQTKLDLLSYGEGAKGLSNTYCTTVLFVFLGILIIMAISVTFYTKRNAGVFLILTLPFVLLPMFVGRVGFYAHMIIYLVVAVAVFGTGHVRGGSKDMWLKQKASLILVGIMLVCGLVSFLIYTPHRYTSNESDFNSRRVSLQNLMTYSGEDAFAWFKAYFSSDAIDYGKVGDKDELKFTGKKLLEVTPKSQVGNDDMYLKGYVGDNFENDTWTNYGADDEGYQSDLQTLMEQCEGFTPDTFTIRIAQAVAKQADFQPYCVQDSVQIKNIALGSGNRVLPYVSNVKYGYRDDGKVDYESGILYDIPYFYQLRSLYRTDNVAIVNCIYNPVSAVYSQTVVDENVKMQDFVNKYYLTVPEKYQETVLADFNAYLAKTGYPTDSTYNCIRAIQRYFNDEFTYTLSPGKTPEGEDAIEYFVTKNKKGYCVHFASTAVMLLRSYGYASRYVGGLHIGKESLGDVIAGEEKTVEVLDSDMHAWVESYVSGLGFVSFDVTPGTTEFAEGQVETPQDATPDGANGTPQSGDSTTEPDSSNTQTDSDQLETTPTEEPEEDMTFEDIESTADPDSVSGSAASAGSGVIGSIIWKVVRIILILALIIALIHGQWMLRRFYYMKNIKASKRNSKVRRMYQHVKAAVESKGNAMDESDVGSFADALRKNLNLPEETATAFAITLFKANYGGSEVSEEEYVEYRKSYHRICRGILKNANILKKLIYRYVYGM